MGNGTSTITNAKYSSTTAVAEAYLSVVQDISQGLSAEQVVAIFCDDPKAKELCNTCVARWAEYREKNRTNMSLEDLEKLCDPLCNCKMSNIKLGQQISVNLSTFMENTTADSFSNTVMESLAQKASQQGGGFFEIGDRTSNTIETITKLYSEMRSDTFQSSMEDLRAMQTVVLSGPGNVFSVDMTQTLDYVSAILQSNSGTSSILQELSVNILQLSTQVANAGLAQLIAWIVRIVVLIIILTVLFYAINLILQIYSLYVR